ncbi:MAG TPA: lipopolysaccharide heptosyltransferase II [Candidatus Tectomicrobia bacterium]
MPLEALRQILVIRLSSIGDILLTTPILRLLRQHCPGAQIDVVVKAAYRDLLQAHPCIDRLVLFQEGQRLYQLLHILRQTRYDVVLDLHRTLRSGLLYHGLLARHKLAYNKRTLRRALLVHLGWNTLRRITPVPELYAAPLRRLGINAPVPPLEMYLEPGSQEAIRAHLTHVFPEGCGRPLLALAPGAHWPTKRWPVERFAAVAQELAHPQEAAVVILGSTDDVPLAQALCHQLSVPVLNSTGTLSLMQTAALLRQCRLLLSNDSGLMHMATALKVPVVAIFGPTVQEFGFYPFQARAQVVSAALACRPCSTKGSAHCPRGHHHCMQQITSTQVLSVVQRLWEDQGVHHDQAAL